jgi:hypothetical protein
VISSPLKEIFQDFFSARVLQFLGVKIIYYKKKSIIISYMEKKKKPTYFCKKKKNEKKLFCPK